MQPEARLVGACRAVQLRSSPADRTSCSGARVARTGTGTTACSCAPTATRGTAPCGASAYDPGASAARTAAYAPARGTTTTSTTAR